MRCRRCRGVGSRDGSDEEVLNAFIGSLIEYSLYVCGLPDPTRFAVGPIAGYGSPSKRRAIRDIDEALAPSIISILRTEHT